ncbi:MAG: type II secretion system major pseudopilin GspG [Candidatus Omnitrophica bacterium]|nr:type II secretion system major pseudopilin GspG [Candidatus Omnitrophota bacterium]
MKSHRNKKGFTRLEIGTRPVVKKSLTGFTLVELMLVVIIISILVAMVMPRLAGRTEQAREAAAKADIELNIGSALDLYELDNGAYPKTEEGLNALLTKPTSAPNWRGPYLKKRPVDPWGNPYVYKYPGTRNVDYDLYSYGRNGVEGGDDDITNWDEEGTQ